MKSLNKFSKVSRDIEEIPYVCLKRYEISRRKKQNRKSIRKFVKSDTISSVKDLLA